MEIVTTVKEVRDRVKAWKKEGKQVGADNGISA